MNQRRLITIMLLLSCTLFAQAFRLSKPFLNDSSVVYEGLGGNGVTQIVSQGDSLIWYATGGGLSKTDDFGETFYTYYSAAGNLPKGGISAIAVLDSIIFVAGVFDSTTVEGSMQTGGGLAYSKNYGQSWTYLHQPVDTRGDSTGVWNGDTIKYLPVTTAVSNTTWDIAISRIAPDSVWVYITSWAGGIRRSCDFGKTWQRLPLPSDDLDYLLCSDEIDFKIDPRDPAQHGNHNHKGFSVLTYGDTVWVGTADGVNLGIIESDDCIRWQKFNARNSNLSGNFIIAIARQYYNGQETIWVGALTTDESGQIQAVNKTGNGGLTWSRTLIGERVYNFAFDGPTIYVCTERGLFKSIDGENWALYAPPFDAEKGENIYSEDVYAALVDRRQGLPYLWLGSSDGIAKTTDDGINWTIYRQFLSTSRPGQPPIYAYPNPFAPSFHNYVDGDGHVRIQYHLESPATVKLEVFDFAMNRVYKGEPRYIVHTGDNSESWNGRNKAGDIVANGTYFCKLTTKINDTEKEYWTKLIVVK
ncbi:MAG: FlgD immunoglobulin-like domain containing protein [Fidelibacterota bacterium]